MGRPTRTTTAVLALVVAGCNGGSDDGGSDPFQPVHDLPEVSQLSAVWAFAPDDVWVAADAGKMLHFDGAAWETTELGPAATMVDLWAFGPNDIWAVGGNTLARFDGATWELTDLQQQGAGISSVSTIWGSSPTDIWVGGDQSTAAHFDGTTWTRYIAAGTDNVALWGSGPQDVYVGSVFDVARFDGTQWTSIEDEVRSASAIFGFAPDDVWVADDSDLYHFDGGTWETRELDGIGGVLSMWGASSDDIWGVGDFGSVYHYDGEGWTEVQSQTIGSPYLRTFFDVHGSASSDVWAVGAQLGDEGVTPQLVHYTR